MTRRPGPDLAEALALLLPIPSGPRHRMSVALLLHVTTAAATPQPRWGAGLAARCEWAAERHGSSCQHIPAAPSGAAPHPGVPNCTEHFFEQTTDHFSFSPPEKLGTPPTFEQRYFINDQYWLKPTDDAPGGPVFFYTGNEANVELYVNATGLIWENCAAFNCLIIFAEPRYWGKSLLGGKAHADPADPAPSADLRYLTHEQALADYATLLHALQLQLNALGSPVISFGGSYGGMLSYWMRQKYPASIDGAIAASAPVLAFKGQRNEYDSEKFCAVVTRDATPAAGSVAECAPGVRAAWKALTAAGETAAGRRQFMFKNDGIVTKDHGFYTENDGISTGACSLSSAFAKKPLRKAVE